MGSRHLSASIIRLVGGAGLTTFAMHAFAQPDSQKPTPQAKRLTPGLGMPTKISFARPPGASCIAEPGLNSCRPHQPVRALTSQEIDLIMGANYQTDSSSPTSHGSCNSSSCHVTASPPPSSQPSSSAPPPSSPPPDSAPPPNEGGGAPLTAPSLQEQAHLEACARIYGGLSPKPGFQTNFTSEYGWSSHDSTGLPLKHLTTATETPPPASEIPPGGSTWLYVGASTYVDQTPLRTDIYMMSYTDDANLVKVLVHEWYHQNYDIAGESSTARYNNEANANAAGVQAENAYTSDGGAKCAGL